MQPAVEGQATSVSVLLAPNGVVRCTGGGLGVVISVHVAPFHTSASVSTPVGAFVSPTAMQSVGAAHDTAWSVLPKCPFGSARLTAGATLQCFPFQISENGTDAVAVAK